MQRDAKCVLRGQVQFDFRQTSSDQLTLIKNQVITILSHGPAGGWSRGQNNDGKTLCCYKITP
jgi:hypothetical protein